MEAVERDRIVSEYERLEMLQFENEFNSLMHEQTRQVAS